MRVRGDENLTCNNIKRFLRLLGNGRQLLTNSLHFLKGRAVLEGNDSDTDENLVVESGADRLANIAMDTGAYMYEQSAAEANIVEAATAFLDNDVDHWLETSYVKNQEPQGPVMTPRNMIISRIGSARRRSAVQKLELPST